MAIIYICEAIGSLDLKNGKRIEVIYGVSVGSTYSHAFFNTAGAQNWVTYNPFNDQNQSGGCRITPT